MTHKATRFSIIAACLASFLAVWAPRTANAQARGQIILTQEAVPSDLSGAKLQRWLKKNEVKVLKPVPGKSVYKAHLVAKLSSQPSASLLNLPHNGGKLHLAFYVKSKRGWKYINVIDITYQPGAMLQFPITIPEGFGLVGGGKTLHQMRITILNRSKRESVLARTTFKVQ